MVNYSSCAIKRALQSSAVPTALAERSWVQLLPVGRSRNGAAARRYRYPGGSSAASSCPVTPSVGGRDSARQGQNGFTIAEAMVAVMVLWVGILALVGSAALTSRMLGRGRHATRAGQVAAARIERLRQCRPFHVPACTGAEWRSDSGAGSGLTESWQILDPAGLVRRVLLVLRSRHPTGAHHRHRRHRHALRPP